MSTNSKRGAYFVPDEHGLWWAKLTNNKFMRFLSIATARSSDQIHSQPPPPLVKPRFCDTFKGKCPKCDAKLIDNSLVLTCDKCGGIL